MRTSDEAVASNARKSQRNDNYLFATPTTPYTAILERLLATLSP